ncbi:MAG: type II 3-dehydroquinate dehydratase [Muribaculaceae bacterium]|nr:type II 3-dehydroquinate dehydratase [Muribaculaceae bacterium]
MKKILILNGPNLNLLGQRQPDIYGSQTLNDILSPLIDNCLKHDIEATTVQSNHEGVLIDTLHQWGTDPDCVGIIFNAGAYTHTSLAMADAIRSIKTPVIEVHLSNTAAREEIRHCSMIAPVCRGTIAGFGAMSYKLALMAIIDTLGH